MKKLNYYLVKDNSYQQCIDTDCSNHHLAGYLGYHTNKTVKVLVQPFKMKIINVFGNEAIKTFIIGLDEETGLRHLILFV